MKLADRPFGCRPSAPSLRHRVRHCERARPAFARSASYGGFGVRRSAEREGGRATKQSRGGSPRACSYWIAPLAMTAELPPAPIRIRRLAVRGWRVGVGGLLILGIAGLVSERTPAALWLCVPARRVAAGDHDCGVGRALPLHQRVE